MNARSEIKLWKIVKVNNYQADIARRIDVDSMSILRRYVEKKILTNLHVASTYFFDVISTSEKSKSFQRTLFDVLLMINRSILFQCSFFDEILMGEQSTYF